MWVSEFPDRHGKPRLRFRRKGHPTYYFKSPFGTEGFRTEYRQCLDGTTPVGADRIIPGSISDLIARYYRTQDFLNGAPATQMKNRGMLEAFRNEHGEQPAAARMFEHVDHILAKKAKDHPAAARNLRKVLRRLFEFAVKVRLRSDNPVEHTARIKATGTGHRAWTEQEVAAYQKAHPLGTTARLAMELMLWTGNRVSDAVKMTSADIIGDAFHIHQKKTGKAVVIPIAPDLRVAMDAMPSIDGPALLVTSFGKPFSDKGFSMRMAKWVAAAGLSGISSHGLRKTISNRMALAGVSNQGIKSITGHSADSEVALYTRGVDQKRLANETMGQLVGWAVANLRDGLANQPKKGAE